MHGGGDLTPVAGPDGDDSASAFVASHRLDRERVNDVTKTKLQNKEFSYQDMEQVLGMIPEQWRPKPRAVLKPQGSRPGRVMLGLYAHGSFKGISNDSTVYEDVCRYVNGWLESKVETDFTWTSVSINMHVESGVHMGAHNNANSPNVTCAFGKDSQGELWLEISPDQIAKCQKVVWRDKRGVKTPGKVVSTYHRLFKFNPKAYHATMPWRGTRFSIVAFTARSIRQINDEERDRLVQLGFRCGAQQAKHFLMCDVEDDQAADQSACCHDFDGVFDQVNEVQSIGGMSANEMFKRMIARAAVWIAHSARRPPRTRDHV